MESHMYVSGNRSIFASILVFATLLSTQACASRDWLDKGRGLLEVVKEQTRNDDLSLGELSLDDMGSAFKQALRIGSEKVTRRLGSKDGFNADAAVRIPLPPELGRVKKILSKIGMSRRVDEFVVTLNRAAEAATPKARALFWQAIKEMTFRDARQIYEGPDDAASRYFQEKMSTSLKKALHPVVHEAMAQVGAVRAYDRVIREYHTLPLVPKVDVDITGHVVDKTMAGIFHYIAKEEAAIRNDPAQRTTELLKRVFGRN